MSVGFALAFALSVTINTVSAHDSGISTQAKAYFLHALTERQKAVDADAKSFVRNETGDSPLRGNINPKDIDRYTKLVWEAWREANKALQEDTLVRCDELAKGTAGLWILPESLEPDARMPYYYGYKGERKSAMPLFLYLHGSGPKEQEWKSGLQLGRMFNDAPSLYFIPRIPNEGDYYRWWQLSKQYAWEKLLRLTLASGEADANRLYVFGISEGGYGSQRLASFYADYWAAAGPMAGGEPLKNAPVENCANIGFSFLTGADDMGFYRNVLTYFTQTAFDSVQLARPLSVDGRPLFMHRIHLMPGMQHAIDYSLTTPWLKHFVRRPYPKTVLWEDFEMDGRHRSGFYNLQVLARPSAERTYYAMDIDGNTIRLDISDVRYTTVMTDPQWGIQMKFSRSCSLAHGGRLRIYLCRQLVDLSKPVVVVVNGREVFRGTVKADLKDMVNSCMEYFDPERVYPASVEVAY